MNPAENEHKTQPFSGLCNSKKECKDSGAFEAGEGDSDLGLDGNSEDGGNAERCCVAEVSCCRAAKGFPPLQIVWKNVVVQVYLHIAACYGFYLALTVSMWQSNAFAILVHLFSVLGITAGVHRLWAHRSYKAKLPLRMFLAFLFATTFQNDIIHWSRDHRVHHKFSETDADPHNSKRGFFFSHIGWTVCRKSEEFKKKAKTIGLSDLCTDPVVVIMRRHYKKIAVFCTFILPTVIPMYYWNETFLTSFMLANLRLCWTYQTSYLVNSLVHRWGSRPYDGSISPTENWLANVLTTGEGFHNYHHVFPYDYNASEYGMKLGLTTAFINAMGWLGQAYDFKVASMETVKARKLRTGEVSLRKSKLQKGEKGGKT